MTFVIEEIAYRPGGVVLMALRGIRGATTVNRNREEDILDATRELLENMVTANAIIPEAVAAVLFSATPDLNQTFPARAARLMGWHAVPLFGMQELAVSGAPPRCIRVLVLVNTGQEQKDIKHVYLRESRSLREDLAL